MTPEAFNMRNNLGFSRLNDLETALTHSSYAYEHHLDLAYHNERLEFLGDAVLQLAVTRLLYTQEPLLSEGMMTRMRALLVCEQTLGELARTMNLGEALRMGRGEKQSGGDRKISNLSNAMEAVFGALVLDRGFDLTAAMIVELLGPWITLVLEGKLVYDHKSKLLELVQADKNLGQLVFTITGEEGPVHERIFFAAVSLDGQTLGEGRGGSKKEAEQNAAAQALQEWRSGR